MNRRTGTRLALALGSVLTILAITRHLAIGRLEAALRAHGVAWSARSDAVLAVRWLDITGPSMRATDIRAVLGWPPAVTIGSPVVDLSEHLDIALPARTSTSPSSSIPAIDLQVKDLTLTLGDTPLLTGLSGPVLPRPDLAGPDGSLIVRDGPDGTTEATGKARIDLEFAHLRGRAQIQIRAGAAWMIEMAMPTAEVTHPLLSQEPIALRDLTASAFWIPETDEFALDAGVGPIAFHASGVVTPDLSTVDLNFRVPRTDLSNIVDLFGEQIPEAGQAEITGTLALTGTLTGPPWAATFQPAAVKLGAAGVLSPNFRRESVQWRGRDAEGQPVIRETGPHHPDWVSIDAAGSMVDAVIAAEDAGFPTHDGYDIHAVQAALDAAATTSKRVRGGSTLTQQLAKNLFLDNRRTLRRKLRELLLALDLERVLPKRAILALYLNIVEFGPGIYGIGPAADAFFLKRPSGLSIREAAYLAAILPAPRTWYERAARGRRPPDWRIDEVIDRMVTRGSLSKSRAAQAKHATLRFVLATPTDPGRDTPPRR